MEDHLDAKREHELMKQVDREAVEAVVLYIERYHVYGPKEMPSVVLAELATAIRSGNYLKGR